MIKINGIQDLEWMKIRMAEKKTYNIDKIKKNVCGFVSDEYLIHLQVNKLKGGAK